MSIRRNFDDVYSLFERIDDGVTRGGGMALDVMDDDEAFVVTADLPGFESDDVSLRLRGRTLAIEAARETTGGDERTADGISYVRRERGHRSFTRTVELPGEVRPDDVSAELVNGVLTITLPKAGATGDATRIDVR